MGWLILVVPFSTALKCIPIQGWRNSGCGLNDSNITACWSKQGIFKNNHAVKFLACGQKRRETWWVPAPWTWRVCYATAVLFMVTNCLRRWVCILQTSAKSDIFSSATYLISLARATRRAVFATQYPSCYKSCEYKNIDLTWENLSKVGTTLHQFKRVRAANL